MSKPISYFIDRAKECIRMQLLKLLVVLVCLGAIVARLLPILGYPSVL